MRIKLESKNHNEMSNSDVIGQLGARQPQCDEAVIKMRYLDMALCNNYLSSSGIVKDIDDSRCGKWCSSVACALRAMGCAPEYQAMNGAYRVACQKELNVCFNRKTTHLGK
jgi:hypothetical protein